MKRETIIVGGEDYCKYDRGLVLLQFENDTLLFSSLYTIDDEDEINQENLDNAKENYENNFIKLMKFSNNEIETVYDHQQKIVTALSIKSAKIKNGFIEVRLLNNRTDESVMISEIYILLKKTNLTF